jgi:hypothetical protein
MTATVNSPGAWEEILTGIGMEKGFVSRALVSALQNHGLNSDNLSYDSFGGIVEAEDELGAAIKFTQETAGIHLLQEFLLPAVNWERAWEELSASEGYMILPTHLPNYWAVMRADNYHKPLGEAA